MWPFTSQRIFASRWWALGFVVFVCWQVAEVFGDPAPGAANTVQATDFGANTIDEAQLRQISDNLNNLQNAE